MDWELTMTCGPLVQRARVQVVKAFFGHLVGLGIVRKNPCGLAEWPRGARRDSNFHPYIYSRHEVATLLAAARNLIHRSSKVAVTEFWMMHWTDEYLSDKPLGICLKDTSSVDLIKTLAVIEARSDFHASYAEELFDEVYRGEKLNGN